MTSKHDSAYKDFFSHKQVVIDFLRDYVQQPWVQSVDLSSLQRVNSSYVQEADKQRIGDAVWRLRLKNSGDWVYMYLLLEFQSEVDRYMALRMMVYVGMFYQDLIKQKNLNSDGLLPPIFPAVIYSGKRPWSAPKSLSELITPVTEPLRSYLPSMNYFLLDEGKVQPLAPRNTLSTIIQLERAPDAEQLSTALEQVRELLSDPEHSSLRRALLAWLEGVILENVVPGKNLPKLRQLQEEHTMLAENAAQWTQQWLEEGRQKGLLEGKQAGLQEGRLEGLQEAAIAFAQRGTSVVEIAQALDLEQSEVRRMLESAK